MKFNTNPGSRKSNFSFWRAAAIPLLTLGAIASAMPHLTAHASDTAAPSVKKVTPKKEKASVKTPSKPAAKTAAKKAVAAVAVPLQIQTERKDAIYQVGEPVKFVVQRSGGTNAKGQEKVANVILSYVIDDEGPNKIAEGTITIADKPVVITATMKKPGFLRCTLMESQGKAKRNVGVAAAAVSPAKIEPSLPAPQDFDQFWANQKAALAKVKMEATLTPVFRDNKKVVCFDVQVTCLGGRPVSGYLSLPKDAKPKSLPAVLWVHGAGVRSSSAAQAMRGAGMGFLSFDINAHGIPNGKPNEFYEQLNNGELKGYRHAGRDNRETSYFIGMYLRLVRAIDFLTSQPEWNGKVLAVIGHSQGGGQALVAGGLDPRVTFIGSGVPAMCDHSGLAANRVNGWPKLVPTGADGKPEPKALDASRYVDAVNFAARCKAEAIMSVGFIDFTCPPTTNYAAFNLLQGKKQIINEPQMGHAAPTHIVRKFDEALLDHAKRHQ